MTCVKWIAKLNFNFSVVVHSKQYMQSVHSTKCVLQSFDAVGWAAGRASGL